MRVIGDRRRSGGSRWRGGSSTADRARRSIVRKLVARPLGGASSPALRLVPPNRPGVPHRATLEALGHAAQSLDRGQRRGRAVTPDGGEEVGTVRGHVLGNVGLVRDNIEY